MTYYSPLFVLQSGISNTIVIKCCSYLEKAQTCRLGRMVLFFSHICASLIFERAGFLVTIHSFEIFTKVYYQSYTKH